MKPVDQEKAGQFVAREVYGNINAMVEYILRQEDSEAPFTHDDIENMFRFPEYYGTYANFPGGTEEELTEEIERLEGLQNDYEIEDSEWHEIQGEIDDLEHLEEEPQEIFEWWLVSGHLAEKLRDKGEPVIMDENIWGRTSTGQAILLDSIINEILNGE